MYNQTCRNTILQWVIPVSLIYLNNIYVLSFKSIQVSTYLQHDEPQSAEKKHNFNMCFIFIFFDSPGQLSHDDSNMQNSKTWAYFRSRNPQAFIALCAHSSMHTHTFTHINPSYHIVVAVVFWTAFLYANIRIARRRNVETIPCAKPAWVL